MGSGLLAVPSDQTETAAAFGVGAVGDDAEVANPVAVAQQLALARADADREITPRRDRVLLPDAVAGQVVDLGPLADCVGFVILYNLLSAYKRVGLPEEFHTASIAALPEEHWKPDQNVETQPGGVGAELLTGQGGAGEFGRPSCP